VSQEQTEESAGQAAGARAPRALVQGTVVSARMRDTIVVREDRSTMHPLYKKYVRRSTRYYAHDAGNTAGEGDVVEIMQSRPLSKLKRWRLVRVLRRGHGAAVHADPELAAGAGTADSAGETPAGAARETTPGAAPEGVEE
jgi:small subunit ribosomal protein S17